MEKDLDYRLLLEKYVTIAGLPILRTVGDDDEKAWELLIAGEPILLRLQEESFPRVSFSTRAYLVELGEEEKADFFHELLHANAVSGGIYFSFDPGEEQLLLEYCRSAIDFDYVEFRHVVGAFANAIRNVLPEVRSRCPLTGPSPFDLIAIEKEAVRREEETTTGPAEAERVEAYVRFIRAHLMDEVRDLLKQEPAVLSRGRPGDFALIDLTSTAIGRAEEAEENAAPGDILLDFEPFLQALEQVIASFETEAHPEGGADEEDDPRALAEQGGEALEEGRCEEALSLFQRALRGFRQSGNRSLEARCLVAMGRTHGAAGDYRQAADRLREGAATLAGVGDANGAAEATVAAARAGYMADHPDLEERTRRALYVATELAALSLLRKANESRTLSIMPDLPERALLVWGRIADEQPWQRPKEIERVWRFERGRLRDVDPGDYALPTESAPAFHECHLHFDFRQPDENRLDVWLNEYYGDQHAEGRRLTLTRVGEGARWEVREETSRWRT